MSLKKIEVSPTFYPLNSMKIYKKYARGTFKNSEEIGFNGICLPSSRISLSQQKYIIKSLKEIIKI